ncbi:cubilin-like [Haliotis asinina]|uniref:cubilin-like n=1 Tax=Haliotis asinina TaxID=109174 RepID=UPI0035325548
MKLAITSAVLLSIFSHGLTAQTDACFKDIQLPRYGVQNVTSPGFPHPFGPNVSCGWKIRASSKNHLVGVYVAYLHLDDSRDCQHDNLSFFNGSDTAGGMLLQLCGNETKESSVLSSGDAMYIEFVSGSVARGIGFSLSVIDVERCGGRVTATSVVGNFTLPGYPYTYFKNLTCIWIITAENQNNTIAVAIEGDVSTGNVVRVFNGNTTQEDQYLGELDESMIRTTFYGSKDSLLIEFTADGSSTRHGLKVEYIARPESSCHRTIYMDESPRYVVSPGYPDSYPSNLHCEMLFVPMWSGNWRLDVLSSDIDGDYPQCDNDSVTLSTEYNHEQVIIGNFCGNSSTSPAGPYYSNRLRVKLVFKTGSDTSGTGFRLRVSPSSRKVVPPATKVCGPRFLNATTHPNFLQSPGYPVKSRNDIDCIWVITASDPQMMVHIDVIDSDVQTESQHYLSCQGSRVTAFNGPSIYNDTILFWCGLSRPSLQSIGPAMTVRFTTQNSKDKRGFKLKYFETNETFRCGRIVNVSTHEDTIVTGPYGRSQDCHWTIYAPAGTNIQVNITYVERPAEPTCYWTYLELYDGDDTVGNNGSTTPGRWCGIYDSQYISSGNVITARLHIDVDGRVDGLQLYLRAGHFNVSSTTVLSASVVTDYFTSPNYPFDSPRLTESTWKIKGDSVLSIQIAVLKSILDSSDGCRMEYVEAFDGSDSSASSLGRWCGESTPTKTGFASSMFLKFRTNSNHNPGRRFKISYYLTSTPQPTHTGFSLVGAIIGCCIAGIVMVGMIVITIWQRANRKRQPLMTEK